MKKYNFDNYIPPEAFPAGEFLADELEARQISIKEFAGCCGMNYEDLKAFIHNKRDITKEESEQISDALGLLTKDFFFRLQELYYRTLQHNEQRLPSLQRITRAIYRYMVCL